MMEQELKSKTELITKQERLVQGSREELKDQLENHNTALERKCNYRFATAYCPHCLFVCIVKTVGFKVQIFYARVLVLLPKMIELSSCLLCHLRILQSEFLIYAFKSSVIC